MKQKSQPGPDFLCIGMQKGGTRWLYDAMNLLPGAMMPPIKEINHFALLNGRKGSDFNVKRVFGQRLRAVNDEYPQVDEALRAKFRRAARRYISAQTHMNYRQLFCLSGDKVTGDISPAYSTLASDEIAKVHRILPDARIILSLRHPVARSWSQFNMHLRLLMGKEGLRSAAMRDEILVRSTPDAFDAFLKKPRTTMLSSGSIMFDRWSQHYKDIMVIDFNDIVTKPATVICRLSQELLGVTIAEDQAPTVPNGKESSAKAKITPAHTEIGLAHFKEEIARCRARFDFCASWEG